MVQTKEGKLIVDGYKVWFRQVGTGGTPLLVLHGGPGAAHDYLEPLGSLAIDRAVVFYDQLGCGRSDQPDDRSLWRIDRFVNEIDLVRNALGLNEIHLLGHSWGGWLSIEYMLSQPQGVVSLVLASTSASLQQFAAAARRLKQSLPANVYRTLQHYEKLGDFRHRDYRAAVLEFYKRHVCRLDPWPDQFLRSDEYLGDNPVYETMLGPNEFNVIGNLKDWDRSDRISEITVPTLVTVGRYDEMEPACSEKLRQAISNSRMVLFENSSHMPHLEEPEQYCVVVASFLEEVEKQQP